MEKNNKLQKDIEKIEEVEDFILFLVRNGYQFDVNVYTESNDLFVEIIITSTDNETARYSIYTNPVSINNCIIKSVIGYLEDINCDYYDEAQEMYGIWLAQQ
jgi:predicted AlkP superfamily phosphohydrolase/phosphomutase